MGGGSGEGESFVFIRDPEYAWIPCTKIGGDANKARVKVPQYEDEQSIACDGGAGAKRWEEEEVALKDYNRGVLPMQNVDASGNLKKFPDMVNLPFLHEVSCSKTHMRQESSSRRTCFCADIPNEYPVSSFEIVGWPLVQLEGSSRQWQTLHSYG